MATSGGAQIGRLAGALGDLLGRVFRTGHRDVQHRRTNHPDSEVERRFDTSFAFRSELGLDELRGQLNARGSLEWIERDSTWYGDYISARIFPDYAFYKIYDDDQNRHYVLQVKLVTARLDSARRLDELATKALDELAAIDIHDVEPCENYD